MFDKCSAFCHLQFDYNWIRMNVTYYESHLRPRNNRLRRRKTKCQNRKTHSLCAMRMDSCKYFDVRSKLPKTSSTNIEKRKVEARYWEKQFVLCLPFLPRKTTISARCTAQQSALRIITIISKSWFSEFDCYCDSLWMREYVCAHKDQTTSDELKWIFNERFYG